VTRERVAEHPTVRASARLGLSARGALYVVVGILALGLVFGDRNERADQSGALAAVARQPFGKALLVLLALGFAAYAIWMAVRVVVLDEDESAASRWAKRGVYAARALIYASLCASSIDALRRSTASTKNRNAKQETEWTARLLGWPFGRVLVIAIGLAIIVGGLVFAYRGGSQQWRKTLDLGRLPRGARRAITAIGWAGWIGRGLVFALVGVFLVHSAVQFDPNDAVGLDGSLRQLANGTAGRSLLVLAAFGLFAFGAYSFVEARYRRVGDTSGGPD
jgi:hypothetical protein